MFKVHEEYLKKAFFPSLPSTTQITLREARQQYLDIMTETTSSTLHELLVSRFQVPTTANPLTVNEQRLFDVLELMRCGRMTTALNTLIRHWKPSAIDAIMTVGVDLYDLTLKHPGMFDEHRRVLFQVLVSRGIHNQVVDLNTLTAPQFVQMKHQQEQRRQAGGMVCSSKTLPLISS